MVARLHLEIPQVPIGILIKFIQNKLNIHSPQISGENFSFTCASSIWHDYNMSSIFLEIISDTVTEYEIRQSLKRFAYSKCHNSTDAEDLVQLTYEKALKKHDTFVGNNPKPWMFKILENAFKDSKKKITETLPGDDLPEVSHKGDQLSSIEESEASKRLENCIEKLSTSEKDVIGLRRAEFSISEIVEILELSRENISQISFRAKIKLCDCMGIAL